MTTTFNTFEGGTNGTTISTANSGGTSGDAWSTVFTSNAGTATFSNTSPAHGSLCGHLTTSGTAGQSLLGRTFGAVSATMAARAYYKISALPTATHDLLSLYTGSSTNRVIVSLTTAGKVQLKNAAGTVLNTSTTTISTGAWFRLEVAATSLDAATGAVTLKLFVGANSDGATADETLTPASNGTLALGGTADKVAYGQRTGNVASMDLFIDDTAANDTGSFPGPYTAPNFAPTANAGPDQTVQATGTPSTTTFDVALTGTASTDPESATLTYSWAITTTTSGSATLVNATTSTPILRASKYGFVGIVTLTVTDPGSLTSTDPVAITVNPVAYRQLAHSGALVNAQRFVAHSGSLV